MRHALSWSASRCARCAPSRDYVPLALVTLALSVAAYAVHSLGGSPPFTTSLSSNASGCNLRFTITSRCLRLTRRFLLSVAHCFRPYHRQVGYIAMESCHSSSASLVVWLRHARSLY